jgi:uncharacterized membrane protein YhdT
MRAQPSCDGLAYATELPAPPDPTIYEQNLHPAYWAVGVILIAVAVYELVAVLSHYVIPTISQGVQRGPRWFRWSISLGLVAVVYHFLFQGGGR